MNLRRSISAGIGRVIHRRERTSQTDQHAHEQYIEKAAANLAVKKSQHTAYSRPDNNPWGT